MKCYCNRYNTKLLGIKSSAPVTVSTAGTGYRILPNQADTEPDSSQDYRFVSTMNVAGGADTPAARLSIQGSVDGVTWFEVAAGTNRTAPGAYVEVIDAPNSALLPWVRAFVTISGGTPPSVDAVIDIVSTGPFELALA